jgi:hypothetical protein
MNTRLRIQLAITAINEAVAAGNIFQEELSPEVRGITHGLSEYFLVETVGGSTAAVGYSEAELLANLIVMIHPLERMRYFDKVAGMETLLNQQSAEIEYVSKNFDYSVFAGAQGPLSGSGCRDQVEVEGGAK